MSLLVQFIVHYSTGPGRIRRRSESVSIDFAQSWLCGVRQNKPSRPGPERDKSVVVEFIPLKENIAGK